MQVFCFFFHCLLHSERHVFIKYIGHFLGRALKRDKQIVRVGDGLKKFLDIHRIERRDVFKYEHLVPYFLRQLRILFA
ncbi:hypothetical protein SDC9_107028 [bioreactor metagenome]|uniref:Uncharacterized protein n=1 Tax=bioreactor metagenome TaxID=1076179 RepID=A0A645B3Y2_9ZZZZ